VRRCIPPPRGMPSPGVAAGIVSGNHPSGVLRELGNMSRESRGDTPVERPPVFMPARPLVSRTMVVEVPLTGLSILKYRSSRISAALGAAGLSPHGAAS
jgi:hypothetical protein